ncbi:CoA pyrophosphatase [Flavobacterium arcticum]|uniref:CoA pyrophosphatase n=1 Tax=Flavobacterium arcticum TaxID=1784713 RepID=A0A345HEL7_9FLAO|nr:CoA pyrophosphatase [Flavobacterium arcticum]AXG75027.1 CoA pyrophosphatase [Flavobacterium arcticum]KAF2506579.1 CoA pyrophosphatase [Flavobacterium arcticum]
MKFTDFIKYIPKIQKEQLPAALAHIKMAPLGREVTQSPEYYAAREPKKSAVMMLFYPKDGVTHLTLIKRNTYPGVHSAQISFPGGKVELEDKSLEATAVRETCEEVGVSSSEIEVIMPFSEIYIPPSNFLVYPFLGLAVNTPNFKPDIVEVAEIIALPLSEFLDDSIIMDTEMKTSYAPNIKVPGFKIQEHFVWGATAMIMSELKETIKSVL